MKKSFFYKNLINMKNTKISELTPEQIDNRINSLLVLHFDDVINYLLYLLDIEYLSSTKEEEEQSILSFISDKRLRDYRVGVMKHFDI